MVEPPLPSSWIRLKIALRASGCDVLMPKQYGHWSALRTIGLRYVLHLVWRYLASGFSWRRRVAGTLITILSMHCDRVQVAVKWCTSVEFRSPCTVTQVVVVHQWYVWRHLYSWKAFNLKHVFRCSPYAFFFRPCYWLAYLNVARRWSNIASDMPPLTCHIARFTISIFCRLLR